MKSENIDKDRALNILAISSMLPYPPSSGGATRLYNLYSRLANRHNITWLCPMWPDTEVFSREIAAFCVKLVALSTIEKMPFPNHGIRNLWFKIVAHLKWKRLFLLNYGYVQAPGLYWLPNSPERKNEIARLLQQNHYDLLISEFEGSAELTSDFPGIPKVIALHNILSTLFKRARRSSATSLEDKLFFWPEMAKIARYERTNYSRFDLGITCSVQDEEILHRRCPKLATAVIPNGVDLARFTPDTANTENKYLLYFGHYGYPPNADAVFYFGEQILPQILQTKPEVRCWIVGHEPLPEFRSISGLDVIGSVPDVRPYIARADIVIVPLRSGSGTRLKILEAMAMGKAVVSTTLGAEGLHVTSGEDIILADTPEEFAQWIIILLKNPEKRCTIGLNARKVVEKEYSWDTISSRFEQELVNVTLERG